MKFAYFRNDVPSIFVVVTVDEVTVGLVVAIAVAWRLGFMHSMVSYTASHESLSIAMICEFDGLFAARYILKSEIACMRDIV